MTIKRKANAVEPSGACSLLSPQGLSQVELLIGDSRFTNALNALGSKSQALNPQSYLEPEDTNHPLPPNHVIMDCVNGKILLSAETEVSARWVDGTKRAALQISWSV